uniref:ricin B-like lectin R40G2 n=1 Tax=Erigeron canadensis TaxID=72917 RepID=UPI001CB90005|nr:ricin B-like lectin R40G2 [Erigeron canadensis]
MYYCDGHTHHHLDDIDDDNNDSLPLLLYNPSLHPDGNNDHINNYHHHNNLEEPLIHDDRFNGQRRGVWIYLCFQCMESYRLNHHQFSPPQRHVFDVENKPTVRVYCKAKIDFSLTVRDGQVILAPSNPFDPHQHWIKDEICGKDVKDEEGFSSFALVNKATGLAMKHSIGVKFN